MQLLWADVTYLLINVKHRINMTLIVLIETLDILKITADLTNTLQFKQMMNL